MWRLVGIQGIYKGRFFDLDKERLLLGKEDSCGICLREDGAVAERQSELVLCNGCYMYRDMDSQCPTVLNGVTMSGMMALSNGDSIQIGESIFRVESPGVQSQASIPYGNIGSEQAMSPTNARMAGNTLQTNGLAIGSLVASVIIPLLGLILGIISLKQINRNKGTQTGEGIAIAAIVVSSVFLMFTLLLLPSIAIPNFIRARETARASSCVSNLRQLDVAKEQWAMDNRKVYGDTVGIDDLIGPDKYVKQQPVCPSSGTYELRAIGISPTCSIPGHAL